MKYLKIILVILGVVGVIYFFNNYEDQKVDKVQVKSKIDTKVDSKVNKVEKKVVKNDSIKEVTSTPEQKNIPKYKDIFNDKKLKQIREKAYQNEEHAEELAAKSKQIIADTERFLKEKNLVLPVQNTDPKEIEKLEKSLEDLKKSFN